MEWRQTRTPDASANRSQAIVAGQALVRAAAADPSALLLAALLSLAAAQDVAAAEPSAKRTAEARAQRHLGAHFAHPKYLSSVDWREVHADPRFFERVGGAVIAPWRGEGMGFGAALKALNAERRANALPWLHAFQEGHPETEGMPRLRLGLAGGAAGAWSGLKVELRLEDEAKEAGAWRDISARLRPAPRRRAGGTAFGGAESDASPAPAYRMLDVPALVRTLTAEVGERRFGMHQVRVSHGLGGSPRSIAGAMTLVIAPQRAHELPAGKRIAILETPIAALNLEGAQGVGAGNLETLRRVVAAARSAGFDGVSTPPTTMVNPSAASPYDTLHTGHGDPRMVDLGVLARQIGFSDPVFQGSLASRRTRALSARQLNPTLISRLTTQGLVTLWGWFKAQAGAGGVPGKAWGAYQAWVAQHPAQRDAGLDLGRRRKLRDPELALFTEWAYAVQELAVREAAVDPRADGAAPMALGWIRDQPVVTNGPQVEQWPDGYLRGMHAGAPPDDTSPNLPQDWGGSIRNPLAMIRDGLTRFAARLTRSMANAGGLRLDNAFWIHGLFSPAWTADGAFDAARSGYVAYPFPELMAVITLLSRRHHCLVIAENLGTPPAGFDEKRRQAGLYGYALARWAYDWDAFRGSVVPPLASPRSYESSALAAYSTWDMPPVGAVWNGADLRLLRRLGKISDEEASRWQARLPHWRYELLTWLERAGELPAGIDPQNPPSGGHGPWTSELDAAYRRALAKASSQMVATPLLACLPPNDPADSESKGIWNVPGLSEHTPPEGDGGFRPFRGRTGPISRRDFDQLVLRLGTESARPKERPAR
ncbi:MAG: 4-alpha-glucanotransferase [Proteobacteria bacterium]|nr:4-alpha-glucanotransferase [Pseudomonadota bacterium]